MLAKVAERTENKARNPAEPQRSPDRSFPSAQTLERLAAQLITGYVVEVTPAMAKQWLNANTENRRLRRNQTEQLTRDIVGGRWRITHQGIAFSKSGRLIDGQHRLTAIVRAGQAALLTVFTGLDDDMFGALDRGARRTVADELMDDSRYVDPCSWLVARINAPSGYYAPVPEDVRAALDVFRPELTAMIAAAAKVVRHRNSAGAKAAFMIRLKMADDSARKRLLEQWRAFILSDFEAMDKTTGSVVRRLDGLSTLNAHGRHISIEIATAVWLGFDPARRDLGRIVVRDADASIAEIVAAASVFLQPRAPAS